MKDLMPPDAVRQKMKLAGFKEADVELFLSGAVSRLTMPDEAGGSAGADTAAMLSSTTLKPAPAAPPKPPAAAGGMMGLLGEIQRGQKLKAVQAEDSRMQSTTAAAAKTGDMLSMLAMKMSERRFKMGSAMQAGSDSDSDSSGFSDSDSDSDEE